MKEYNIKVGIKTSGEPVVTREGDINVVHNMLIGDGFHWEKTIEARLPGTLHAYKKDTQGVTEADKNVTIVNELPVETYLECVVGSEMNPRAPMEFLKAHAVISRSWAMGKVTGEHKYPETGTTDEAEKLVGWDDNEGHQGFHVCSDDHCQRYQGRQEISPAGLQAIQETAGEVLTDTEGHVIDARFSKCCGGRTELFSTCWQSVEAAGIESFDDPWCDLSELSEADRNRLLGTILKDYDLATEGYGYRWTVEITKEEIEENLKQRFGRNIGKILQIEPLHKGPSGRIDLLRIQGTGGNLEVGKELWIRRLLSPTHLYSSAFEIEDNGSKLLLRGQGWGHGAGLCQIGAANMAMHGHDYRDILAFYYPGSILRPQ